jgi:HPt (histidine-containing phosphotransfer) domain-containing protein
MINWQQIKQLEEDVGPEDLAEVVTLFLSEVDDAVSDLNKVAASTPEEIVAALHFLKGSAYNLGFQTFGEYCSEGEIKAKNGDLTEISFEKVEGLYEDSRAEFLAHLPDHCAIVL